MGIGGPFAAASAVASAARSAPEGHTWSRRVKAFPSMVRAVLSGRWSDGPRVGVTLSLLGILYVLSPLDLIPEVLLGPFGLGDDLAVLGVSVVFLVKAVDTFLDSDVPQGPRADFIDGEVIQGEVVPPSEKPAS